ncbi:MAG: hypothetical protein FJ224_08070 [Lentisphaerae bacterium]|nr:hypothetical protein [Lentisphaerota bacterium]
MPDGYHFEPAGMGRFEAWIRVSYPTSAGDRIRRRIAEGRQLSELWAQASALQGRRDYASAIPLVQRIIQSWRDPLFAGFTLPDARTRMDDLLKLQRGAEISARWAEAVRCEQQGALREATEHLKALLKEYDAGLGLSFNLADVQLKLGDLYAEQKDFLEARRCYDAVRKSAPSRTADAARRLARLPAPPRLWPLNDRWGGGKVALLCSIRDENGSRAFGALAGRLTKDCGEARIPVLDISSSVPGAEAAAAFDNRAFTPAVDLARRQGAGVLLAVLFDIDPARRGKTEVHFGEAMPAVDSRVRFFVLKTADGSVLYTDQFKEIAGTSTSDRLAERAATIMVNNYLVPKCPAVK